MNAIKCDKCGKFEEFPLGTPTRPDWTFLRKPRGVDYAPVVEYAPAVNEACTWHLCPSCWKAVEQFITEPLIKVAETYLDRAEEAVKKLTPLVGQGPSLTCGARTIAHLNSKAG